MSDEYIIDGAASPLSPVGAKIFGADSSGNPGWIDRDVIFANTVNYRASGSDDTAALQAILTAAAGKRVYVTGDCTISNELVLPQGGNVVLELAHNASITNAVGSTNGRMLVNYAAVNVQRTITDGAITAGATALSGTTFTSADVGRTVIVTGAGWGAGGSGPGPFVANILSVTGGVATLSSTAKQTVTGASVAVYDRDSNIAIIGGTWNRGAIGYPGSGADRRLRANTLFFRRVDGMTVDSVTVLGDRIADRYKYAMVWGDATRINVSRIHFDYESDGVHFTGPAHHITVRDVTGYTEDDVVPIMNGDADDCDNDVQGDISHVLVENINAQSSTMVGKLLGGRSYTIKDATFRNISSDSAPTGVMIFDDANFGIGDSTIHNVLIDGVRVKSAGGQSVFLGAKLINDIIIRNIMTPPGSFGHSVYVLNGVINDLIISGLQCSGAPLGASKFLFAVGSGAVVHRALLSDISYDAAATSGGIVQVSGAINRLSINGIVMKGNGNLLTAISTAILPSVSVSNGNFDTLSGSLFSLPLTCEVSLLNIRFPALSGVALFYLAGASNVNISLHGNRIMFSDSTAYKWWNLTPSDGTTPSAIKSTIPNLPSPPRYAAYSSSKTYATGDIVFVNSGTKYFQSLQNGNINNTPPGTGSNAFWNLLSSGTTQMFTDGGTAPVAAAYNNDLRGYVTMGTGSPTTITVHFNTKFAAAPHVDIMPVGNTQPVTVSSTTTGFTVSSSATFTGFSYRVEHME